ncbi:SGNH/GDSL hydrolase family protein [Euzebya rosea]|uniref:SGNH/GDSL hydrolase family protein n=1 Tax=Euzebya rosea TaxID=2052804 RepID=UPI000D3E75E0|nr:SGNH/GDSL hydrolase family protein [Euzebya rosea]
MLVFLALLSALVVGALSWLLIGQVVAVAVVALMLISGLLAQFGDRSVRRPIGTVLLLALLAGGTYGTIVAVDLVEALTTTDGAVEMADQAQLASAEDKLEGLAGQSSFQLELTEPELQAVVQDGLAAADDVPVRRVELDLRAATGDIGFRAVFKAGGVEATGNATISAVDGGIDLELGPLEFGSVQVPSLAAGAIQSLLGAVTDLNAALEDQDAVVRTITVTDDALVVTGTRGTDEVLTDGDLLAAIRDQATGAIDAVRAPPERIGRGRLAGLDEPGDPIVLALGDSLAANVGVEDNRDGFVSRFHRFVADADGTPYGLVNLAVPGETSGSLLTGGQLDAAEAVLGSRAAAWVVIDIGANDLLNHLTSPECGTDLTNASCQQLVDETLVRYRTNLEQVMDRLVSAAGSARVVFLQTYNPFSLGLGESAQERESSAMVARLNAVAAEVATARGVAVADGFTPMQGTTAATTHMLDAEPDIHPNAAGHDVLAGALVDAR